MRILLSPLSPPLVCISVMQKHAVCALQKPHFTSEYLRARVKLALTPFQELFSVCHLTEHLQDEFDFISASEDAVNDSSFNLTQFQSLVLDDNVN